MSIQSIIKSYYFCVGIIWFLIINRVYKFPPNKKKLKYFKALLYITLCPDFNTINLVVIIFFLILEKKVLFPQWSGLYLPHPSQWSDQWGRNFLLRLPQSSLSDYLRVTRCPIFFITTDQCPCSKSHVICQIQLTYRMCHNYQTHYTNRAQLTLRSQIKVQMPDTSEVKKCLLCTESKENSLYGEYGVLSRRLQYKLSSVQYNSSYLSSCLPAKLHAILIFTCLRI